MKRKNRKLQNMCIKIQDKRKNIISSIFNVDFYGIFSFSLLWSWHSRALHLDTSQSLQAKDVNISILSVKNEQKKTLTFFVWFFFLLLLSFDSIFAVMFIVYCVAKGFCCRYVSNVTLLYSVNMCGIMMSTMAEVSKAHNITKIVHEPFRPTFNSYFFLQQD